MTSEHIRVHAISLGCPKNRVDTENLLAGLPGQFILVAEPEAAEIVIINTCGFILPAVEESVRVILEISADLSQSSAGKTKPLLAVTGCLVSRYGEASLKADLPEVDLWLSVKELGFWPARVAKALSGREWEAGFEPFGSPEESKVIQLNKRTPSTPPGTAYLKIAEGCNHACSFCTIPQIRGPLASQNPQELVAEAKHLADLGVRELVLVAQDLTAYGKDLSGREGGSSKDKNPFLYDLLEGLAALPDLDWIRLMYLYPAGLSDSFLSFLSSVGTKILPYFDIPLQHAHPGILCSMGRPFAQEPMTIIDRVRAHFPEAAIRTSLICGYPGEGEAEFAALCDFVKRAALSHVGVFAFSPEEGTKAALLPGQVAAKESQKRKKTLLKIQEKISRKYLKAFLDTELDILVEAPHPEWPGLYVGRSWFQAPEVDGITYISGPEVQAGIVVKARIIETKTYDLVALT